jgi:streptogramin lyase
MLKKIIFLLLVATNILAVAQTNQLWKGYFSYSEIKDIANTSENFIAASENALFLKNFSTNNIQTINTIDGLSSQTISAIFHSETAKKTLVGYQNGLLIIIDDTDKSIQKKVDIISKQLPSNIKKINHFYQHQNIVYLSCDFGIVQFNLNTLLFGDTYFIGTTTAEIQVNQTTVFNGFIYAATENFGLKRADINNPNLIDVNQWTTPYTSSFAGVTSINNTLIASENFGQTLKSSDGLNFTVLNPFLPQGIKDVRVNQNRLIITSPNTVLVYNDNLVVNSQVNSSQLPNENPVFTCATVVDNTIYIGTKDDGLITTNVTNTSNFLFVSPNGPAFNNIFSINASTSNLWAVFGSYDSSQNPAGLKLGFSKFNAKNGWKYIPNADADNVFDLVRVTVNPVNENQIFVASYQNGLLKFENDVFINRYDQLNSGLESLFFAPDPSYKNVRIEQPAFDRRGNLWMTNGNIKSPLKVLLTNGQWGSYNLESVIDDFADSRASKLMIDKNSTKWIVARADGLIGFNENFNNKIKKVPFEDLPSFIQTAAIDLRNQIWIGTRSGLRILSSVDSFLNDEPLKVSSIIILDNGVAQELLFKQYITDIVVDGANNKWIATADSGVFQFSPNGQETLNRFTTENSPLPSNVVNDIDINPVTGEVFFATDKGMVSFKGTAIKAADNLENVVVYPNPVRPEFEGNVTITGLTNKANVKITDIEGNLVYEKITEGGSIDWNTTAFGKYKVASGVYMIFIAAKDGEATKVKKIMIVR